MQQVLGSGLVGEFGHWERRTETTRALRRELGGRYELASIICGVQKGDNDAVGTSIKGTCKLDQKCSPGDEETDA